jgi:hypothetical protein
MARFNAMVLALIAGAVIGTVLRPGLLEIVIVGALIFATAGVVRARRRQHRTEPDVA